MMENQPAGMVACKKCGHQIHSTAVTCPSCGASQRSRGYKSKVVAAIITFFFGGFGIHRFYLGQWWGIFYLLLSWTLIPSFIALIEFIVFLFTDQQRWDMKYNEGIPAGPGEGTGGGLVAVLVIVGIFVFIVILGVLTAIAVPAYQDYTMRTHVHQAMSESASVRLAAMEYILSTDQMPSSNREVGLSDPHITASGNEIIIRDGHVQLVIYGTNTELDGKSLFYSPSTTGNLYEIVWICSSFDLEPRLLPMECR